jgi:hypothetical protein
MLPFGYDFFMKQVPSSLVLCLLACAQALDALVWFKLKS